MEKAKPRPFTPHNPTHTCMSARKCTNAVEGRCLRTNATYSSFSKPVNRIALAQWSANVASSPDTQYMSKAEFRNLRDIWTG